LKTGEILPIFNLDGTTPVDHEQLMSLESGSAIFPTGALKIWVGMPLSPKLVFSSNFETMFITS